MHSSKICFKCKKQKELTEFYQHNGMKDGRLNKCKDCTKSDALRNRLENIDRVRAYDRERAKNTERSKFANEISKKWRQSDSRRMAAHNAVARAVRAGILIRIPCSRCGSAKSVAHHENYDNKLDVIWLCQPCHKIRHKEMVLADAEP